MMALYIGGLAGMAYGLLIGPLFFAGIKATVQRGKPGGLSVMAGSLISDLILAFAGWLGAAALQQWIDSPWINEILHFSGGLILVVFGIATFFVKPKIHVPGIPDQRRLAAYGFWPELLIGFSIHTFNPSNWLFWIGLAAAYEKTGNGTEALLGAMIAVILANLGKILLTYRIARMLDPKWLVFFIRAAGAVILVIGLGILIAAI